MSKTQTTDTTKTVLNAQVKAFKQTVTDNETGNVVKEMYYIKIITDKGNLQINTGETNYNKTKEITQ